MENAIETVKVIHVEQKEFSDKETGELKSYCVVTSISTHNEIFIFNDYENIPKNDVNYGMYLTHDKYMRAKIQYKMMK